MIDWIALLFNSLWILALAGLLALLNAAYYTAQQRRGSIRKVLGSRTNTLLTDFFLLIFCTGLAGSASTTLERILWIAMALIWGIQLGLGIRKSRTDPR